ncbi:MAG TPA: UvrD-helicase domain-containing protein [Chthoniobacterales bacterium]|jgi:ATP-dependent exoDNAse (exonuclease V) beta subunit|nr:UvrD-helicase domain-containing protein [Chthoniobacterales bacterium]
MVTPSDESARARFATELDRNFSVVASAGSGKTTAITQRILSIARSANAAEILPRFVVVTFTNRAADEMQQRTRQALLQEHLRPEVQTAFNRAFFGTIHSFCMKLLTDFGHYLGLPAPLELVSEDDDNLWQEFAQNQTRIGRSLGEKDRAILLRFVQARDLMELARRAGSAVLCVPSVSPCPALDFADVYAQPDRGNDNISKSQAELREWEKRYAGDWEYLRWPVCFTAANARFTQLWQEKFAPLRKWVCNAATCVAAEVQRDYLDFRLDHGLVTYGDQIALAKQLLQHPVAARRIREENFRVILDEAQDTEPSQFSVLLEATRPPHATGDWMETRADPPPPGHFCMVGDFQQSIYWERADLKYYKAVHDALIADKNGESLEFAVTFRLDQKQLNFVNETFREILNEEAGQVRFVELQPRPNILPGTVIRVPLNAKELLPEGKKLKDYQKARIEADYLARWIRDAGLKKLSVDSWREVAILCPRKAWLQTMAAALRRVDLPVAMQSERDVKGDSPAYAWLTALLTVMVDPLNAYEIVGVLREIFGVSDHDLAVFSEGQKASFRIDQVLSATGKISSHLRILAEIRQRVEGLALFDAVALIVDQTQLRERLLLLPATEFGDLARELDALLAQAAQAETSRMILAKFAEHLRDDFTTPRAVRFSADDNAIQLITSHKAKGSEWQAVIVPFLARDLRPPSPRYPHFVKSPVDGELVIAFGREDKSKELKDAIERAQQQQLERLLYVATTRARHALVVVLDQEIFSNNEGKLPRTAQLRRLIRNQDSYSDEFDQHSSTIDDVPEPSPVIAATSEKNGAEIEPLTSKELKRAAKRASEFVRKLTPSALDVEVPAEVRTRSRLDNLATLYGRWWHRFFERLDWKGGLDSAQKLFGRELPLSPDAKAATKDWNATRQNLFSDENIARFLAADETQFHHELPFCWRRNDRSVLEGLIDSLMIDRKAGRCLLLDWKTNNVSPGDAEIFRARYRPQLAAYWKVVAEITGLEVDAGLFSTALGRLLLFPKDELREEWRRLEQLPPTKFEEETRPDAPDDF